MQLIKATYDTESTKNYPSDFFLLNRKIASIDCHAYFININLPKTTRLN